MSRPYDPRVPAARPLPSSRPVVAVRGSLGGLLVGLVTTVLVVLAPAAGAASSAPTPLPEVSGFGPLEPATPTPGPGGGADTGSDAEPLDPGRLLRLVLAGAVVLGAAGATGLYLTRERS